MMKEKGIHRSINHMSIISGFACQFNHGNFLALIWTPINLAPVLICPRFMVQKQC